jgi:hypothetical protein
MPLSLILHDLAGLAPDDEKRFFEAIFQIAPEHWRILPGTTLVSTGVSPAYLLDHLLRALPPEARAGTLLVTSRVPEDAAWHGLPAEGASWVRDASDA